MCKHKTQNGSFQTFEDILCLQCCRQLSDIVSYIISLRAVPIGPPEFCLFAFCLLFSIYTCFVLPILMGLSHRKLNKYVKIYRYPSQSTVVHPFADDCFILGLNMIHETNMDCWGNDVDGGDNLIKKHSAYWLRLYHRPDFITAPPPPPPNIPIYPSCPTQ